MHRAECQPSIVPPASSSAIVPHVATPIVKVEPPNNITSPPVSPAQNERTVLVYVLEAHKGTSRSKHIEAGDILY